jgi:hypothetical protein
MGASLAVHHHLPHDVLQRDEWLVSRRYLSAESISLVLTGQDDHTPKTIKEEMPEPQAA